MQQYTRKGFMPITVEHIVYKQQVICCPSPVISAFISNDSGKNNGVGIDISVAGKGEGSIVAHYGIALLLMELVVI